MDHDVTHLLDRYTDVRAHTERLAAPLYTEDQTARLRWEGLTSS